MSQRITCPYCGTEFSGNTVPKHNIPEFADEYGEWVCFGSEYEEPTENNTTASTAKAGRR